LPVTVWYLEQTFAPAFSQKEAEPAGQAHLLSVQRVAPPALSHYRWLFDAVGGPWNWTSRKLLEDSSLMQILEDPRVEVLHLEVNSTLAGFAELDRRLPNEVELKFFGLLPAFIGQKLGTRFLDLVLQRAWNPLPRRVWLHTCSNDHPAALRFYQAAGFRCYREEIEPSSPGPTQSP